MLSALSYVYSHVLTIIIDGIVACACAAAFGFIAGFFMGGIYDIKKNYGGDPNNDATPAILFSALGAGILAFAVTIWMINVNDALSTVISQQICNAVIAIIVAFIVYHLYGKGKRNTAVNSQAPKKHRPF